MARIDLKKALREAAGDTGNMLRGITLPAQGIVNAGRDAYVLGKGAYDAASRKDQGLKQAILEADRSVPRADFASKGVDRLDLPGGTADTVKTGGEALGTMAVPGGLSKVRSLEKAGPLAKSLGYNALRGAEGAVAPYLERAARTGDPKEAAAGIPGDVLKGALFNAFLSPRLSGEAMRVGAGNALQAVDNFRLQDRYRGFADKLDAPMTEMFDPGKIGGRDAAGRFDGKKVNVTMMGEKVTGPIEVPRAAASRNLTEDEFDRIVREGGSLTRGANINLDGRGVKVYFDPATDEVINVEAERAEFADYLRRMAGGGFHASRWNP